MSNAGSYPVRTFSEDQTFLVYDPGTSTTSRVLGSDLVSYIAPSLNAVIATTTRLAAQNEDYSVGTVLQTTGDTVVGVNASLFLVVPGGEGDFPMLNGNDLLVLAGDDFLREQLASDAAGEGASLVSMEGGPTVEQAVSLLQVGQVSELSSFSASAGEPALVSGVPYEYDGAAWVPTRGYTTPEAYGAIGDGITDDTLAIQACIDFCIANNVNFASKNTTYLVSKNTSLTGFPDNDQPCLLVRDAANINFYGNGAKFKSNVHGQGVFEILNCQNVNFIEMVTEGYGNFPPLDGTTGRGEKGVTGEGYSEPGFETAFTKNNSVDTSSFTGGGYGGAFPREGGGTGSTWGTWGNGGYIGNIANGFLVDDGCENIVFTRCGGKDFNTAAFEVGFLGYRVPTSNGYERSKTIKFVDCWASDCYVSGVQYSAVDDVTVQRFYGTRMGHPDFSYTDDAVDPGYGTAAIRADSGENTPAADVKVIDSTFTFCARKGIDTHGVNGILVSRNVVEDSGIGVHIKTESSGAISIYANVLDNIIRRCGMNGWGICVSSSKARVVNGQYHPTIVRGNSLIKCCHEVATQGVIFTENVDNINITENMLSGVTDGFQVDQFIKSGFRFADDPGLLTYGISIKNNIIDDEGDNSAVAKRGIRVDQLETSIITGNNVRLETAAVGIYIVRVNRMRVDDNSVTLPNGGQGILVEVGDGIYGAGNTADGETTPSDRDGLRVVDTSP